MAWLAVDRIGDETISQNKPEFDGFEWCDTVRIDGEYDSCIYLPKGTIRKIIGKELTLEQSPIEI